MWDTIENQGPQVEIFCFVYGWKTPMVQGRGRREAMRGDQ